MVLWLSCDSDAVGVPRLQRTLFVDAVGLVADEREKAGGLDADDPRDRIEERV